MTSQNPCSCSNDFQEFCFNTYIKLSSLNEFINQRNRGTKGSPIMYILFKPKLNHSHYHFSWSKTISNKCPFKSPLTKNKVSNKSYFLFDRKNKEATQRTLIKGPGAKLNIIERKKPIRDMTIPNIEDRPIATHKDGACCNPNKVGVESKAITRMTPIADIELTITSAVVKPRAKFKKDTLTPLEAAPSGSNPIWTSLS